MQVTLAEKIWIVIGISTIFAFVVVGLFVIIIYSNRKVIGEQLRRLEETRINELRYRNLFEHSEAGMMKFDFMTWIISDANTAILRLFGSSSLRELQKIIQQLPWETSLEIQEYLRMGGAIIDFELCLKRPSGENVWLLWSARREDQTNNAYAVVIDITSRKENEEKIEEQAKLLDETRDAIIVTDLDGHILFWNNAAECIYGWDANSVFKQKVDEVLYPSKELIEFQSAWQTLLTEGESNSEHRQQNRAGKEILVDNHWRKVQTKHSRKEIILMINTNITEKKRLESLYLRTRKMESIALLMSGITHDLQNILAPVSMSASLLKNNVRSEKGKELLRAIEISSQHGLELVNNIMTIGRGYKGEEKILGLDNILEQLFSTFRNNITKKTKLVFNVKHTDLLVQGDEHQLKQVFLNLLINAKDALIEGEGVITVTLKRVFREEIEHLHQKSSHKTYALVSIQDTGVGIAQENIEKIFDPFFTTKSPSQGTGLGLSLVESIVRSHGGIVTIQSAVNEGTNFMIYLPERKVADNLYETQAN